MTRWSRPIALWAERSGWLSRPTKTPAVILPRSAGVRSMVCAMRRAWSAASAFIG